MKNKPHKNNTNSSKRSTIFSIAFLVVVLIGVLVAVLYRNGVFNNFSSGDRKINMTTHKVVKGVSDYNPEIVENPDISYPGYDKITLKANKLKQSVYLHNPTENTCFFVMTIVLSDGETIWQSEYIEPGNAFNRIELNKSLEKGTYENAVLRYDSFSIKDGRKLNGASINLTLVVE